MGDYAKAEPLFERALKIREKALGPEHPDTATASTIWRYLIYNGRLRQGGAALSARAQNLRESAWALIIPIPQRASTIWLYFTVR